MQLRDHLACVLLMFACTPKPADTDGGSSSSGPATDGAEASSVTQTDPANPTAETTPTSSSATSEGMDSGSVPGSAAASSMPGETDSGAETGVATEADTEGGLLGACLDVCMLWEMCEPGSAGPLDKCVAQCTGEVEGTDPACVSATNDLWLCVAGLPCEEALKFLEGPPTSCLAEVDKVDATCVGVACDGEIGGDPTMCEHEQNCGNGKQNIECTGSMCLCFQDDVQIKECVSEGLCELDAKEQAAAIFACCGFDWKVF